MHFQLDPAGRVPIFQQLVNQVRQRIATGELRPGDRLPTVRDLAVQLVVNPNTVQKAYGDLAAAGLVHSRKGQGLFVSEPRPTLAPAECQRRVVQAAEQFITDGLLLGYRPAELRGVFTERLKTYLKEDSHEH